jgi:hypothetical protein
VDEIAVVGDAGHVRAEVARREAAGVSTLLVGCRDAAHVRELAGLLAPGVATEAGAALSQG